MPHKERKRRSVTLRKNRQAHVTGFVPGDLIMTVWDQANLEWRLLIESANGIQIENRRVPVAKAS